MIILLIFFFIAFFKLLVFLVIVITGLMGTKLEYTYDPTPHPTKVHAVAPQGEMDPLPQDTHKDAALVLLNVFAGHDEH